MHTPGPWRIDKGLGAPEIISDNRRIARVLYHLGSEDREVDSNARLIAAVPELLETCQDALNAIETLDMDALGRHPEIGYSFRDELANNLQTAITKATRARVEE